MVAFSFIQVVQYSTEQVRDLFRVVSEEKWMHLNEKKFYCFCRFIYLTIFLFERNSYCCSMVSTIEIVMIVSSDDFEIVGSRKEATLELSGGIPGKSTSRHVTA